MSLQRRAWIFAALLAAAQATGAEDKHLALTIYNNDLALVEHVRPLALEAGRQRVEFEGVSAGIMSQTVSFEAAGIEILEQNFDYDLLTPEKLMEKAVGQRVRIVRTNPGTGQETQETAEVLSTVGGVVLRVGERIEVLRDDGLPARVIFDRVPPNLRASPTLSLLAEAARPVRSDITVTYLTHGLSWSADYVAVFRDAEGVISMQGWITLENNSGTTFENAATQLVAGDINLAGDGPQYPTRFAAPRGVANVRAAGVEPSAREQLADYYVYPLAEPTTVANAQRKQVSFLSAERVAASRGYEQTFYGFESQEEPISAEVRVRFSNSAASGLGDQLPSGVVRVYARDARGQPQFVGEDRIGHTSAGSELALKIGEAFDVTVQPTLRQATRVSRRATDYDMSYLVRNARSAPITVTIRQDNLWRFNEIRVQSIEGRRTDADSFAWDVPVPANGETELTFTLRQSY
jgi:hypothetical protein